MEKKNDLPLGELHLKKYLFVVILMVISYQLIIEMVKFYGMFLGSEYNSVYTTARPLVVKNK